jgi:hypothetical protein
LSPEDETSFLLWFSRACFRVSCLQQATDLLKELVVIYLGWIQFDLETGEEVADLVYSSSVSIQPLLKCFIHKTMGNTL